MNNIVFTIVYIGDFPWYFPYFLHSCCYNPTVDFLIFTDNQDISTFLAISALFYKPFKSS